VAETQERLAMASSVDGSLSTVPLFIAGKIL
jgi:hypothetical protein